MNSMKTGILIVIFISVSCPVLADEMEGSFTDNGSKGTYTVNLQNDLGHVYTGTAQVLGNGSMCVKVDDSAGEAFTGFALYDDTDIYDVYLKNPKTGELATGKVNVDQY